MGTNKEALKECLELSRNIIDMGLGINSKRAACEIYTCLVEGSANLGAYITAADYVPMRSQRTDASVNAMTELSKVIYLLNVANASDMFVNEAVQKALKNAVNLSKLLNDVAAAYLGIDFEEERQKAEERRMKREQEQLRAIQQQAEREDAEQRAAEQKAAEEKAAEKKAAQEAAGKKVAEKKAADVKAKQEAADAEEEDADGFDEPFTE